MNKVWLVTGSASGLGRNIAEAVLESGDRLVATARDTKRLDDLVKKYGDRVRAVPLDVTDESAAQAAVQTAVAAFGRLDVVVNNAGYGDIAPFEQLSAERFKAVMDTNFYGVVNVTRAAVPLIREQRSGSSGIFTTQAPTIPLETWPLGASWQLARHSAKTPIAASRDA
jgi:NAD(P)-dependent dehydrogenase (short-subunit alcohol dehydrogenase family)